MDELLVKYLLQEADADEVQQVQDWLAASESNRHYYQQFCSIWNKSNAIASQQEVDVDSAWEKLQQHIKKESVVGNTIMPFEKRSRKWYIPLAAASLLLIISTGLYFLLHTEKNITLVTTDIVRVDTLPDGSIITLNKNSSLSYASDFNNKTRKVVLQGEAFFNISPNKQKPFIITTGGVNVKVVGTSFNVKNNAKQTEVVVETGIVTVAYNNNTVQVMPQQKVIIKPGDTQLQVSNTADSLYNYYRTHTFICHNTPLGDLVEALNNTYDTSIRIANPKMAEQKIYTTFTGIQLDEILDVISATFNLKVVKQGNEIILE